MMTHNRIKKSLWARALSATLAFNLLFTGIGLPSIALAAGTDRGASPTWAVGGTGSSIVDPNPLTGSAVVNQGGQLGVIDWGAFGVVSGQSVTFNNNGGLTVNRANVGNSDIMGTLTAPSGGSVWVLNPNGVLIGAGAVINAGAFIAAAGDISTAGLTADGTQADLDALLLRPLTLESGGKVELDAGFTSLSANLGLFGETVILPTISAGVNNLAVGLGTSFMLGHAGDGKITIDFANSAMSGALGLSSTSITADGDLSIGAGSVTFGDTVAASLNVGTTGGLVDQFAGKTIEAGIANFNAGTGNITLGEDNDFGTISVIGDVVAINDVNGLIFGASTITDTLTVTADGAITQSDALNVTGGASFDAGTADILLGNTGNNFSTVTILSGKNVTLTDLNGLILKADTTTAGVADFSGDLTVSVGAGGLNWDTLNTFNGSVDLTYRNSGVALTEMNIANGDLTVTAAGAIGQSSGEALTVSGLASFTANGGAATIALREDNDFTTVKVKGNTVQLNDIDDIDFSGSTVGGNLTVTAGGDITQVGTTIGDAVTVVGTAILKAQNAAGTANYDITLNNEENSFGAVRVDNGKDVKLQDKGGLTLGFADVSGNLTLTAGTTLDFGANATVSGDLIVKVGGAVSQSGGVIKAAELKLDAAGQVVTLLNNNDFVGVSGKADKLSLKDINNLDLAGVTVTDTLTLDVVQNLTDSVANTVPNMVLTVGGTVLLDTDNDFSDTIEGTVTGNTEIKTISNVKTAGLTVTPPSTFKLTIATSGDVTLHAFNGTDLILSTDGGFDQDGNLLVSGLTSLTAGTYITLDDVLYNNDFNSVILHAGDGALAIKDINDITLTDVDTVNGAITVTATSGKITATDVESVNGTSAITLTGVGIDAGLVDAKTTGNVKLDAKGGAIGTTGAGSLVTAKDLVADATTGITLNTKADTLDASVTGAGGILISEADAINLLDVDTANGAITVTATSGKITATDVASLTDDAANDITLTGEGIVVGLIDAKTLGDVILNAGGGSITRLTATPGETTITHHDDTGFAKWLDTIPPRTPDIYGDNLVLVAGDFVGEAANPLNTQVNTVSGTGLGSVWLYETDDLTIGPAGLSAANGVKVETINGLLTVNGDVSATAITGDILLAANGSTGRVVINDAVVFAGRDLTILSAHDVIVTASDPLASPVPVLSTLTAGASINVEAQGGNIVMDDGVTANAFKNLRFLADGDAMITGLFGENVLVQAGHDIIDAGDINDDVTGINVLLVAGRNIGDKAAAAPLGVDANPKAIDVSVSGVLTAKAGAFSAATSTPATEGSVYIQSAGPLTIGAIGANAINVQRVSLDDASIARASAAQAGIIADENVKLNVASALTVNNVIQAIKDDLLLLTVGSGDITIGAALSAGDLATVVSAGAISQNANIGAVGDVYLSAGTTVGQNADIASTAGDIWVHAVGAVTMTAGKKSEAKAAAAGVGNIRYVSDTAGVALSILDASKNVSVKADTSITDANPGNVTAVANITADKARLESYNGSIGGANNAADDDNERAIDLSVNNVEAKAASAVGGVYLQQADGNPLTVGGFGPLSFDIDYATFDSGTKKETATDANLDGILAGQSAKVKVVGGNLIVGETVTATADDLLLLTVGSGDITIGAALSAGDLATVVSAGKIDQNANITATAGDVYVRAQGGDITMLAGTTTTAGKNIRYEAGDSVVPVAGNVKLSKLEAVGGAVSVVARGNITDNNALSTDANIKAVSARLEATGSIGEGVSPAPLPGAGDNANAGAIDLTLVDNTDPLDPVAGTVAAKAGGSIYLQSDGAVDVGTVAPVAVNRAMFDSGITPVTDTAPLAGLTAEGGVAKLKADGSITVLAGAAVTATDSVLLLATDGDIELNDIVRAGPAVGATVADLATVIAEKGSIVQNIGADITAGGDIYLDAKNSVSQNAGITSRLGDIWVLAQDGAVTMGAGTKSESEAAAGNIRYQAAGDVTLSSLVAVDFVSVVAGGDIIDANAAADELAGLPSANITADKARLESYNGSIGGANGDTDNDNDQAIDLLVNNVEAAAWDMNGGVYLQQNGQDLIIGDVGDLVFDIDYATFDSGTKKVEHALIVPPPPSGLPTDFNLIGINAGDAAKVKVVGGNLTVAANETVTAGTDVLLLTEAGGDITVNAAVTAGRHATLVADKDIVVHASIKADDDGDTVGDVYAFAVRHFIQDAGSINGRNVRLVAQTGSAILTTVTAGDIASVKAAGNILDGNGDLNNITANRLRMDAGNSIGTIADAFDIEINNVDAYAGGDIYLRSGSTITFGGVGVIDTQRAWFDSGVSSAFDTKLPEYSAPLAPLNGLYAGGNIEITSVGGSILQTLDSAVIVGGTSILRAGQDIRLGNAVNDFGGAVYAYANDIVLRDANDLHLAEVISTGGRVWGEAVGGSLMVDELTAVGDVWLGAQNGDITVARVSTFGNAWLEATGSILARPDTQTSVHVDRTGHAWINSPSINVTAQNVAMTAGQDIGIDGIGSSGTRSSQPFSIDANGVAARANGDIALYGKGNLTLAPVSVTRWANTGYANDSVFSLANITAGNDANLVADRTINGRGIITADQLVVTVGDHAWLNGGSGITINGGAKVDLWMNNVVGGQNTILGIFDTHGGKPGEKIRAGALRGSGALIFINGMYMGGDPRYVARIAAAEASVSDAQELKPMQSVFRDPIFVHDEIAIVEPIGLGLIQYLSDGDKAEIIDGSGTFGEGFPKEILDSDLKPRNSLWFGTDIKDGASVEGRVSALR